MIFSNQASEYICHMIYAMSGNIESLRGMKLNEVANSMSSEVDGLLLALAVCEKCSTIAAKETYFKWVYEHESE